MMSVQYNILFTPHLKPLSVSASDPALSITWEPETAEEAGGVSGMKEEAGGVSGRRAPEDFLQL